MTHDHLGAEAVSTPEVVSERPEGREAQVLERARARVGVLLDGRADQNLMDAAYADLVASAGQLVGTADGEALLVTTLQTMASTQKLSDADMLRRELESGGVPSEKILRLVERIFSRA